MLTPSPLPLKLSYTYIQVRTVFETARVYCISGELKHRIQVDLEGLSQNLEMIRAQGGDLINPYDSVT